MPVPAGPRRAAPPRRKTYKSPPSAPLPEPPAPASVPAQPDSETAEVAPPSSNVVPPVPESPTVPPVEELTASPPDESLVAAGITTETGEISQSVDVSDDTHVTSEPQVHVDEKVVLEEPPKEPIAEPENMEGELDLLQKEGEVSNQGSSMYESAEDEDHGVVLDSEPEQVQQESQPEPEPEEDEATRRMRIAAKLTTMGAFNPLAPLPVSHGRHVEEPVDADTEEIGENAPVTATVPPTVEETEDQRVQSTPEEVVKETKVELEVGEQVADESETVQPALVKRDGES